MRAELLIPLSGLPGPLPAGAPLTYWTPLSEVMIPALDLSPPPLDPAGFPLRIDGLDVAAAMLARAMGYGSDGGARVWHTHTTLHLDTRFNGARFEVPADIDPTDPNAARLAMIAIFKAKPWENR